MFVLAVNVGFLEVSEGFLDVDVLLDCFLILTYYDRPPSFSASTIFLISSCIDYLPVWFTDSLPVLFTDSLPILFADFLPVLFADFLPVLFWSAIMVWYLI